MSRVLVLLVLVVGCSPLGVTPGFDGGPSSDAARADGSVSPPMEGRIVDRAIVEVLGVDEGGAAWWIEERIAGQPIYLGDRELGPRSLVRAAPERVVVWTAPETERLVDAVIHPSGDWSAVGVDASSGVFLVRGDAAGMRVRITLDDPELASDPWASTGAPAERLSVSPITESGVSIVADGEDVVVAVPTRQNALLAYRWSWADGGWARGVRTLVTPAIAISPVMGIGGSYDDFDSYVGPYLLHLGIDRASGRVFVATYTDRRRVARHNEAFGTHVDLLRDVLYPRESTSDVLVVGIDDDGSHAFATVVGTVDVEDELSGIAVGPSRVAVFGRSRRELGRENSELHVMVAELDHDGVPLGTTTFDCEVSGLAEAAAYDGETLYVGGSEGWRQNPDGRSILSPGRPFLARLTGEERSVERLGPMLPATEGHGELRAIAMTAGRVRLGGHERGPLTHTGDADRSLIRSDAWWAERALP